MERSGSGIPGQNGPNPAGSYLSAARGTAHEGPVVTHPSQQPGGQRRGEKLLNEPKNPHQHQQELPLCWDVVYQPWDRNCSSPGLGFGGDWGEFYSCKGTWKGVGASLGSQHGPEGHGSFCSSCKVGDNAQPLRRSGSKTPPAQPDPPSRGIYRIREHPGIHEDPRGSSNPAPDKPEDPPHTNKSAETVAIRRKTKCERAAVK